MMTRKGLSLSELNRIISETVRISFPDEIWFIGEISEMKISSNGHCYLEVIEKDPESDNILAKQRATIWSYTFRMLSPYFESSTGCKLSTGLKILASVQVEFHEIYGLSLNIKDIDPSYTIGDLARKKKEVILRLRKEGVIDMNRNLPFPMVPQRIAVISSQTAAGWGDFQSSLKNNIYGFKFYIELFKATMQGEKAEVSIIEALDTIFEKETKYDVVVIIRGGGATSDMDCFNNYNLVYHITQFPLPVLTGIGHERDETIADIVSHTSLKTPTAVAEFLIDKLASFHELLLSYQERLNDKVEILISNEVQKLSLISQKLNFMAQKTLQDSKASFKACHQKLLLLLRDYQNRRKEDLRHYLYKARFQAGFRTKQGISDIRNYQSEFRRKTLLLLFNKKEQLAFFDKNIRFVDPVNILKRGFSVTYCNGKVIRDPEELNSGDKLLSRLYKGFARSIVIKDKLSDEKRIKSNRKNIMN